MQLDTPVKMLARVGPKKSSALRQLGVETVYDLIMHFPSGHTFAPEPGLAGKQIGDVVTVIGRVANTPGSRTFNRVDCSVQTDSGGMVQLSWFNGKYIRSLVHKGTWTIASGKLTEYGLTNPVFKVAPRREALPDYTSLNTTTYPVTKGVTGKDIQRMLRQIPASVWRQLHPFYYAIHFPQKQKDYDDAIQHIKYDELYYMQLGLALRQQQREQEPTNVACVPSMIDIRQYFPFDLTGDQGRAVSDITRDLCRGVAMNRLLQGDVGCVDADTEFLSPNGWVPISKWSGEKVAQFHSNIGAAEFVDPTHYIKKPCDEFIHLHTKYGVDQMLSPEHRCLVYRHSKVTREYDRGSVVLAEAIEENHNQNAEGFRGRFETSFAMHTGSRVDLTEDQLRLMVAVCADAYIASKTTCVLSFKKRHKIDRALHLLYMTGTEYTETRSAGYTRLRFKPPVLRKGLEQFWGASHGQLEVIAEEVLLWDGNGRNAFYTRRKCEADFVQYAMSATGKRARLLAQNRQDGSTDFVVLSSSKTKIGVSANPKTLVKRVPSKDGFKYCFAVPSTFLVLRRNGCVFVTGNSGKTVVAAYAAMLVAMNGGQTAILCPTQILAKQHYESIKGYFEAAGLKCELVIGPVRHTDSYVRQDIIVGTTSVLGDIQWNKLGLVIIDEQHKFGVEQRAALRKHGNPHCLVMTATPIPRTIAMTAFGDLDVSTLKTMPPGRLPVHTEWGPSIEHEGFRNTIEYQLSQGHQVYVVCPRIEALDDEMRAVEEVADEYAGMFPTYTVGTLHGKMPQVEKNLAIESWVAGATSILISTTVVEVGVDNPNATVIVVEGAERFGLAQLHQLRGRVGRGEHQSYCFLLSDTDSADGRKRLRTMELTNDGFEIAESDLKLRGPGELLSTRQHGLPDLKLADLVEDYKLMLQAREDARVAVAGGLVDADYAELELRFGGNLLLGDS